MTSTDNGKGYCGWSNYETWLANVWLVGNDEAAARYWARRAIVQWDYSAHDTPLEQSWLACNALGDELEQYVDERVPAVCQSGMFGDLLQSAIDNVNWAEIADGLLAGNVSDFLDRESRELAQKQGVNR